MTITCPCCNSPYTSSTTIARRSGALIGALGGAICGFRLGIALGPAGALSGAFVGLCGGAISGCEAGFKVGKTIDVHVINRHCCKVCHHTFNT